MWIVLGEMLSLLVGVLLVVGLGVFPVQVDGDEAGLFLFFVFFFLFLFFSSFANVDEILTFTRVEDSLQRNRWT